MRTNPPSEKFIKLSLYWYGVISHPSAGCWRIRSRRCMKVRADFILLGLIIQNWAPTFTFNPRGNLAHFRRFPAFYTSDSTNSLWPHPIFYTERFWCCIINVVDGGSEDVELPAGLMSRHACCHFSVTADSMRAGESVKMDLEHQTLSWARTLECTCPMLMHSELHISFL